MKIGVPKETAARERRVALVPDVVRRLLAAEHEVVGRARRGPGGRRARRGLHGRGRDARRPVGRRGRGQGRAAVRRRGGEAAARARSSSASSTRSATRTGLEAIAATGATALAMEKIPRISRAQSMDALSSQATVSRLPGGADRRRPSSTRFFPMFMTAAGTVPPAQVLVLGAGVAGLQAIATARRLGAVVTGVRHPLRRQGADPVAGREVLRGRGARRRRGRGRLRARADAGGAADPARRAVGADGQVRRDRHDRAGPGPPGAEADPGDARWTLMKPGQRDRRPGGRGGRQLRADAGRGRPTRRPTA